MEEDNQLIESNNENQESGSNGSNNSIDTVVNNSKDEEEYIKGLLEDDKENLTIVKRKYPIRKGKQIKRIAKNGNSRYFTETAQKQLLNITDFLIKINLNSTKYQPIPNDFHN
ncbi:hypothetical protein ACTA71_010439 [Dictyostelium dimigraforme]